MRIARASLLPFLLFAAPGHASEQRPEALRAAAMTSGSAIAATASTSDAEDLAEESGRRFGGLVVSGNENVGDETFWPLAEAHYGEALTDEVLARLVGEIAELAKQNGFLFAESELVNDGSLGGIVEVFLDEGRIDAIRIDGYQNAKAMQILNPLVGQPALADVLERRLLLVAEIPAVRYRDVRLERESDRSVLVVRLDRRDDRGRMEVDNYGSSSFGPTRAKLSYDLRGLIDSGDELQVAIRTNPLDIGEFKFASASYETRIGNAGTTLQIGGSIGDTAPGGQFDGSGIEGQARRASIAVRQPLVRTRKARLDVEVAGSFINISQDDIGGMLRDDTIVTAKIGLLTRIYSGGSRFRGRLHLVRGLDMLGATRVGDPLASRRDGDGVFTAIEFWSDARIPIGGNWEGYASFRGQLADRPLLSSEEFALGGAYRVRGYDFREVAGDNGIHGLAEIRYKVPTEQAPFDMLQLYAFVEGGQVWDIDATGGEGTLYSAGSGIRTRIGRLDFEFEAGIPLGGSGERRPDPDPEINIRAGYSF